MLKNLVKDDQGLLYLGVLLSILVRWTISLYPYSGQGKPPMFGDYEAQRHWMEITYNLPVTDWYTNSTRNDLMYWGLDYPPLTGYHSWLLGWVSNYMNPEWVALRRSRGIEGPQHKLFMRSTVILADILVYLPAVIAFWYVGYVKSRGKACLVTVTLLYPGLILIDHGHFQYNCVSLGLLIWAVLCILKSRDVLAAILFSLALNYKQMELYHALPFFCYLLGSSLRLGWTSGFLKVIKLGIAVTTVFAVCWTPYLNDVSRVQQLISRLFPVARGLFEDKVANIWCCLSVVIKLKSIFSVNSLVIISFVATLLAVLPSCVDLLRHPTVAKFKLALVNSSLVFFLFSFQVHEKSILLAAVPACLLLPDRPVEVIWFLFISTFSMLPLLAKDRLIIPWLAASLIFYLLSMRAFVWTKQTKKIATPSSRTLNAFHGSLVGAIVLTVCKLVIKAPAAYPDIHTLICCIYCCIHFIGFTVHFHQRQFVSESPYTAIKRKVQ